MFKSATLKLTGWYLLILMVTSIIFSMAIYESTFSEVTFRLDRLQNSLRLEPGFVPDRPNSLTASEASDASAHIVTELLYANLVILVGGGFISYFLARRTLKPIEEAHEAQTRFTSDASHELRTPLAAMKSEIEVALRDKNSTKEELQSVLKSNIEEVDKLTSLSEMLLNLSRLDHDKLELTAIDIVDLAKQAAEIYDKSNRRVVIKAVQHPYVEANEAAVLELISVLVDNALKYSPEDSKVYIAISASNRHAKLSVKNSGPGIDAEALPHIFDRFYRADNSRAKHVNKGYGLGLALAKKIVEINKGQLTATSTPDKTTIFSVDLPLIQNRPSKI
jgi:signal transduction histidine kinase